MSQTKAIVETIDIPADQIKPSPYQPRLAFNLEDIRGSIQRDGILVPLTVRKKDGYYELIDGERRVRLAKELGYKTVPCTVIDVDDETARRMVWKVNTLRQDYTPKEKAFHFRKLQKEYGMSLRGMAMEYGIDRHTIKAYLHTFKLPDEYQQMVWDGVIPIGVVKELEVLFNSGVYLPSERLTPEEAPEIFEILDRAAREKYFGQKEAQESIRPYLAKLRQEQVEKAKVAVERVEPEVRVPETPEELEEAARVLRREAKRRKTPEQIHEEKVGKARKTKDNIVRRLDVTRELISVDEYKTQIGELEAIVEEDPDKALSELKTVNRQFQADIKKVKEKEERKRIEDEARKKVERELLTDENFLRKAAELAPPPSLEGIEEAPIPLEEVSPEELQEVRKRWESLQEEVMATLMRPEVKKRGDLFMNWLAHGSILKVLGSAHCPICRSDWKNLEWKCHSLNLEDAYRKATEEYQKSVGGDD